VGGAQRVGQIGTGLGVEIVHDVLDDPLDHPVDGVDGQCLGRIGLVQVRQFDQPLAHLRPGLQVRRAGQAGYGTGTVLAVQQDGVGRSREGGFPNTRLAVNDHLGRRGRGALDQ